MFVHQVICKQSSKKAYLLKPLVCKIQTLLEIEFESLTQPYLT